MSHEILQTEDGTFAMAYREGDALPWHASETHPQTFAPGASADEIMKAARLDYDVQVVPNCFPSGAPIADSFHISRVDDPGTIFGRFVAGAWQPVQNRDVVNLASRIEADHGFEIITAGALFGGSKVFVQLDAGRQFTLPGNDTLVSRLLATSSHTGTESNKFVGCNTRVVCNNTVRAALGETGGIVAHDHRVEFDADAIITAVGLNAERFGDFAELAQLMATRALSDAEALEYFKTVLGGREKVEDTGVVRQSIAVRKAMAAHRGQTFVPVGAENAAEVGLYVASRLDEIARGVSTDLPADVVTAPAATINPGHDLESARGTLWGAFNTVTWTSDHSPTKDRGVDFNIASNLLGEGTGGRIKARALKVASELLAA